MKKLLFFTFIFLLIAVPAKATTVDIFVTVAGEQEVADSFSEFVSVTISPVPYDVSKRKTTTLNLVNGYKSTLELTEAGDYEVSAFVFDRNGDESAGWSVTGMKPISLKMSADGVLVPSVWRVSLIVKKNLFGGDGPLRESDEAVPQMEEKEDGTLVVVSAMPGASIVPVPSRIMEVIDESKPQGIVLPSSSPKAVEVEETNKSKALILGLAFFLLVALGLFAWHMIKKWRSEGFSD